MIKYLLKRLRLWFLKREFFYGSYAENCIARDKFIQDRDIIILHWQSDALDPKVILPHGMETTIAQTLMEEQKRMVRREFRKRKKAVLYYVEDHAITRFLGYKETVEHIALAK